ncbi:unnamed protein product [Cyclocybe aegerita]|uniref:Nephrocystin 3-like N-terminal domain-containing protein n=1 Tax=Cyclocybe aegerita TaxID=1973307 RepID=A0A8S0WIK2_CYCAE|nr:unnamed protein product [Cyclocybe aegerita]
MFSSSKNIVITAGTFSHVEHNSQSALEKLHGMIASGAMHNSGERFDPPKCYPGTRVAVINELLGWITDNRDTFIHWLYGPAGAGKSAIMQEIAELCFGRRTLLASFFFSRTALLRNDEKRLVSTIAYQLVQALPQTRPYIEEVVENDPALFSKDIQTQLQLIVLEPLNRVLPSLPAPGKGIPHLVLVDGLDECKNPAAQQRILNALLTIPASCKFRVVFLIASRPETHLKMTFNSEPFKHALARTALDDQYQPADDIRLFLEGTFTQLKQTHPLREYLPVDWPGQSKLDTLVRKSSGQFIYAATVARYVSPPDTRPDDRLDVVLGLSPRENVHEFPFAELDALYLHILSSLRTKMPALRIFALVAFPIGSQVYQWTCRMVDDFLKLRDGSTKEVLNRLASVIGYSEDQYIHVFHASLIDFLLDEERSREFYIYLQGEGTYFVRMCLRQFTSGTDKDVFHNAVNCFDVYGQYAIPDETLWQDIAALNVSAIAQNKAREGTSIALIVYKYLQCPRKLNFPKQSHDTLAARCHEIVEKFVGLQVSLYRSTGPLLRILLVLYATNPGLMLHSTRYKCGDRSRPCTWAYIVMGPLDEEFISAASVDDSSMSLLDVPLPANYSSSRDSEHRTVFLPFIEKFLSREDFVIAASHIALYINHCELTWIFITAEDRHRVSQAGWNVDPKDDRNIIKGESLDNTLLSMKHEAYERAVRYLPLLLLNAGIDAKLGEILSQSVIVTSDVGAHNWDTQQPATATWEYGYSGIASGQGPLDEVLEFRNAAAEAINEYLKRSHKAKGRSFVFR